MEKDTGQRECVVNALCKPKSAAGARNNGGLEQGVDVLEKPRSQHVARFVVPAPKRVPNSE